MAERMFKMGDTVVVTGDTAGRDHEFDPGTVGEVTYVYKDGDCEVRSGDIAWIVGGDDLEPCRLSSHYTVKEDGDIVQNVDMVNHPPHYSTGLPEGVEVIDIIRAQNAGYEFGNLLKYALRWQYKNGVEDLKKARVYLDWLIEKEEANAGS